MALMVFIGFWLAGPGPVRVDRAALGCNSSLFSMDVVFLFISFWLAGPGPARVDPAALECNSYMVFFGCWRFRWRQQQRRQQWLQQHVDRRNHGFNHYEETPPSPT